MRMGGDGNPLHARSVAGVRRGGTGVPFVHCHGLQADLFCAEDRPGPQPKPGHFIWVWVLRLLAAPRMASSLSLQFSSLREKAKKSRHLYLQKCYSM